MQQNQQHLQPQIQRNKHLTAINTIQRLQHNLEIGLPDYPSIKIFKYSMSKKTFCVIV